MLISEHLANLLACFKAAFGLWEPLPSIYQDALNLTYLRAGLLPSERSDVTKRAWPTGGRVHARHAEVTADLGYAGEVKANIEAASIRRAQQLVRGVTGSAFLTDQPNDIAGLLDHPVILELKSLGAGDEQALMMALLLNAITEHYQASRGADARPRARDAHRGGAPAPRQVRGRQVRRRTPRRKRRRPRRSRTRWPRTASTARA